MRGREPRRFRPGALLALAAFSLVLLLSPAQHEDLRPDSLPGHCHACTATPVAALAVEVAQALHGDLPPVGQAVVSSERPRLTVPLRAASGRAPPETL